MTSASFPQHSYHCLILCGHEVHVATTAFSDRVHVRIAQDDRSGTFVDLASCPPRVLLGCRESVPLLAFSEVLRNAVQCTEMSRRVLLECNLADAILRDMRSEDIAVQLLPLLRAQ